MSDSREVKALEGGHGTWEQFRKARGTERDKWFDALPERPGFDKSKFMEDQVVIMPLLEDGVVALGDLYDITTGKNVGSSLVHYNSLTTAHLVAHPRKDLEYRFDYICDHIDLVDNLFVSASLKIDVTKGGLTINIFGCGLYDNKKTRHFWEDEIKCTYRNETFSVVLLPTALEGDKKVVNTEVYNRLITGKLKATHVCTELILGGETNAFLYVKKDENIETQIIEGKLEIKVKKEGLFDIDAKAKLDMKNDATLNHLDQRIYVYSKPPFDTQPDTVDEMLKLIKNLPENVKKEQHYKVFTQPDYPLVTGVPLRFKLTPIGQLVEMPEGFSIPKTFKEISQSVVNKFVIMLSTLKDFQSKDYVKRKIYERDFRLLTMLQDQDNPVTMRISEWEAELSLEAKGIQEVAEEIYRRYKQDDEGLTEDDLLAVISDFEAKFKIVAIYQKIEDLRRKCKKEIVGIHISDVDEDVVVNFLSNEIDMEDFYGSERRMKILLHTKAENGDSPVGTFLRLYNLSAHLKTLGADVGVAYPSISQGFKLQIKTNAIESVYEGQDIPFALEILGLAVGKAENVPKLFWTVNGATTGIRLPLQDNISDIPSLIAVNRELQDVKVCPTYLTLREEIGKQDGRMKIVLDVTALESVADSIIFFRRLRSELQKEPSFIPVDWAVGTFDMGKFHDAPVAFAFLDGNLLSICLDNLDVLLLLEQLRNPTPDFEMLKAERLRTQCLYPDRGTYGMQVAELLGQYHGSMTDTVEELKSFAREDQPQLFEYLQQFTLEDAIVVNRELVSGNPLNVISAVAVICIKNFPQLLTNLKTMGWNEAGNTFNLGLRTSAWLQIQIYLLQFLESVNPLLAKADYLRKKIETILETYGETEEPVDIGDIDDSVEVIKNHEDPPCPADLKDELNSYKNMKPELKLKGYQEALSKFVEKEYSKPNYFNLRHLTNFVATLIGAEGDTSNRVFEKFVPDTVGLYIEQVLQDENLHLFPGVQKKLKEHLDNKNYYQTLSLLSKTKYDHRLFMVHQYLYLLLDFKDADTVKKLVNKMGKDEFEYAHYEDLWKNKKFEYYMKHGINSQSVLEGIATYQCPLDEETKLPFVPDFIPLEFQEKLIPMLVVEDDLKFEWAEWWSSTFELLTALQSISVRKSIPKLFPQRLLENMLTDNNDNLKETLREIGALYYWDEERHLFTQPWDLNTISKVIDKIIAYHESGPFDADRAEIKLLSAQEELITEEAVDENEKIQNSLTVNDSWKSISNDLAAKLDLLEYHSLSGVLSTPVIPYPELPKAMPKILPFMVQRAKFLSNHPLTPETVLNYIQYPQPKDTTKPGIIDFDDEKPEEKNIPLVSRGDILTYLFNSSEPVVAKSVVQLLANFPNYALPLVVQNIESSIGGGQSYTLLYPQLKNIPMRWEVKPGEVIENHLFANPFRLTVVVRLGESEESIGKSRILNSVMASSSIFSSINDKGSNPKLGRPISHPGFVELTHLTKETCKEKLWKKLLDSYYWKFNSISANDVLLLANLHGDALSHSQVVTQLGKLGARFLAFVLPDSWENMKQKMINFTKLIGENQAPLFAVVDPQIMVDPARFTESSIISTEDIQSQRTATVEGLLLASYDRISTPYLKPDLEHEFMIVQNTETPESTELVSLIKSLSCKTVRQCLKLMDVELNSKDNLKEVINHWNENQELRNLMQAFMSILRLSKNVRDGAISHLRQEIGILSTASSMKSRNECFQLIDELKESVEAEIPIVDEIRNLHNQVKALKIWIDDRTLGLEHFFRALARAYEIPSDLPSIIYTSHYANHIYRGNEVEIFNRDAGNIFWSLWMKETLLQEMPEGFKDLRVFVVSIVGLISSGKSTLLNALFGSKFSVSIGGGTRGIFIKLIFLEEKLVEQLKVDVIILLDTEGISTIGNVGDEEILQREQQLVAFTIGLSNLTMLNTQGRKLGNMSNVLESVFAKLTTVEKLSFIPDFLLLHHNTRHRAVLSEIAIQELTTALRNVSDLTEKRELDLGVRERIGRRLNKIMRRVKHRDIAMNISPMYSKKIGAGSGISRTYHADVIKLYEKILETCQESDKNLTFGEWYESSEKLWQDLTCHKDNFPLRFTNSEKINEFMELQTKISEVKVLIDLAFQSHDAGLKNEIDAIETIETEDVLLDVDPLVEDPRSPRENKRYRILNKINTALRKMAGTCERPLLDEEGGGEPCQPCLLALQEKEALISSLKGSNYRFETQEKLNDYVTSVRLSIWNRLTQALMAWEMNQPGENDPDVTLNVEYNEAVEKLSGEENRWIKIQQFAAPKTTVTPADMQIFNEVNEHYKNLPHLIHRLENPEPGLRLGSVKAFDLDYYNAIKVFELEIPEEEEEEEGEEGEAEGEEEASGEGGDETDFGCDADPEKLAYLDWAQQDWIEAQIKDIPELMWQGRSYEGAYKVGLVRDFKARLSKVLDDFEQRTREKLLPTFKWEAHIFGILYFVNYMKEKQAEWDEKNQPLLQIPEDMITPPPEGPKVTI